MSEDLDQLADDYVHDLLSFEAKRRFEMQLDVNPNYRVALEEARRRLQALEQSRPEEPATDAIRNRVVGEVVTLVAKDDRRTRRTRKIKRWVAGGVAFAIACLISLHVHYANLAANPIDLEVRGQDNLIAGSEASLRVRLTDGDKPLANVPVEIDVENAAGETVPLARFNTDANGTASPRFTLPDWADGEYRLRVVANTPGAPERIEQPIKLRRSARVALATDKPVYQPGQTIRMRSLAVRTHDSRPLAKQSALLTVTDPKGNIVFKKSGESSKFGIFAADCELADEVNEGAYRIVAKVGDTESTLTVDVRPYVLPKFKIEVALDKPYFKSNEPIRGRVRADLLHGQPVQGQAEIIVDGSDRTTSVRIERGEGRFEVNPSGNASTLRIGVRVTDTADQKHERTINVPIAEHDLIVSAVPRSGSLTTGMPTTILFRVQTPDGRPVAAMLTSPIFDRIATDAAGWASLAYTPRDVDFQTTVTARTDDGRTGMNTIRIAVDRPSDGYVLATDKAQYVGGESLTAIALGRDGPLFIDFVRGGQTVRTESLAVKDGRGELAFDLPPEWTGEIELRSYPPNGSMHSVQSRKVHVSPAQQVNVLGGVRRLGTPALLGGTIAGLPHRPGEKSRLSLALRDRNGKPVVGAVGLAAVDEAVFSVFVKESRTPETTVTPNYFERIDDADDVGSKSSFYSLDKSTYPEKVIEVEATEVRGHLRTTLGWAVLVLLGFGYVCYRVWEASPNAMEVGSFLVVLVGISAVVGGCEAKRDGFGPAAGAGPAAFRDAAQKEEKEQVSTAADMTKQVRVRRYFPETLLWQPELITDENGRIDYDFEFADSITSWRFVGSAITADGKLGSWGQDVTVFQPFFVDVNLPVALTRNDVVTIPVVVSNYAKSSQTVRVELPDTDWYVRTGEATRELTLAEGEVKAVEFRVKVTRAGTHSLSVSGRAGEFADAIVRDVTVNSDGHRVETVANGNLNQPATIPIDLPADAIEGSVRATLKLYPSGFSQLVEGLEGIFQAPHGCFEQTSSTTYPNILALNYLRKNNKAKSDVEERARRYVHLGYQRLLTFEVRGGGFDWYGRGPANRALTAYGLMEFRDMAKVADVDPALIARTRDWLMKQRNGEGSWNGDWDPAHRSSREAASLQATAYIAWAVFQGADRGDASPTIRFLNETSPERIADPYVLALVCNALIAAGDDAAPYLHKLEQSKRESADGKHVWWELGRNGRSTFYGSGRSGDVEATALAVLALAESKTRPDLINRALTWLVAQRAANGTWGSTQATVLALKALLAKSVPTNEERKFEVTLGGERIKSWSVAPDQAEVIQQIDLTARLKSGRQVLEVRELTAGNTPYQLAVRHHVPRLAEPKSAGDLRVVYEFDRESVAIGELVRVNAAVWNRGKDTARMVMLELPIPPGFELAEDLKKLTGDRDIDRVETTAGKAIFYLRGLEPEKVREVSFRLRAIAAVKVTVPSARTYEYYNPDRQAKCEPRVIEITTTATDRK